MVSERVFRADRESCVSRKSKCCVRWEKRRNLHTQLPITTKIQHFLYWGCILQYPWYNWFQCSGETFPYYKHLSTHILELMVWVWRLPERAGTDISATLIPRNPNRRTGRGNLQTGWEPGKFFLVLSTRFRRRFVLTSQDTILLRSGTSTKDPVMDFSGAE